ncbi:MAG: desulfoferrodoxin [Candidatus Cloacimonadota bacterium]|nr:desulfoferrodoxin [Candidatus Cloacimonadota bacterium]
MTQLREVYYCEKCGNVVEVLNEGAPALVCCGVPMEKLEAKTEDASTEKHVPFVQEVEGGVLVKVGQNQAHPMLENHYIKFIEVLRKDKVCRLELKPNDKPEGFFPVKKEDIIEIREWCNLHGLWKN